MSSLIIVLSIALQEKHHMCHTLVCYDEYMITFKTTVRMIGASIILRLPEAASKALPSRGQVTVKGTINGHEFVKVIEPDGNFGHWLKIDDVLQSDTGVKAGSEVTLEIEPIKEWPEPVVPNDFAKVLAAAPADIQDVWADITPMARWEWVRWVNATNNSDTRAHRIEASISKMQSGKRRPCCFNLASCTDPDVAKSGKLISTDG